MGERHTSGIERILHRIEDRIEDYLEEWRQQDTSRKAELAAHRAELWAEAAEREKLLAETIAGEESRRASLEEITREHRVVFVVHSEEVTRTLEIFASEGACLARVIPGRGGHNGDAGIVGSWLVFQPPGQYDR